MRCSSALTLVVLPAFASCATGGPPAPPIVTTASEAEWATLFRPRIAPLADPRIAVGSISMGEERWQLSTAAGSPALVVQKLVCAGLLRRADVQFVERRRFAEAAERERRGLTRPAGAPRGGYLARGRNAAHRHDDPAAWRFPLARCAAGAVHDRESSGPRGEWAYRGGRTQPASHAGSSGACWRLSNRCRPCRSGPIHGPTRRRERGGAPTCPVLQWRHSRAASQLKTPTTGKRPDGRTSWRDSRVAKRSSSLTSRSLGRHGLHGGGTLGAS